MTKGDVRGLVGTKGEAVGNGALVAVFLIHERHHFVEDVLFILDMAANSFMRVDPAGVETLPRIAVHAVELQEALVDFIGEAVMHAKIFILAEIAVPGGENEHLGPGVTDDEQAHVAFDTAAEPAMVFEVHG